MAMRMSPEAAQQPALPDVARGPLVFFLGVSLVLVNFYLSNGQAFVDSIFHKGAKPTQFVSLADTGAQIAMVGVLVLLAQYGGEGAGSFALVFIIALWLLFLVIHVGNLRSAEHPAPSATPGNPSGGNIHKAIQ